jgi:N-acetyl-anhydromuramyl-L-alanine amidase AmpD|tara:strand:+ start:2266 stop:3219 length:954 start_codon:yes stop_codon:yes gene_type:complete
MLDNPMNKHFRSNKLAVTRAPNAHRKIALFLARSSILITMSVLMGCAANTAVYVESTNQNSRVDYIVIHATSENFSESLRLLTTRTSNPVSSHYLVPELNDPSYTLASLRVHSLVPEDRRAWHAGVSYWGEEVGLNDRSIGIEVVNEFKCSGTKMAVSEIQLDEVECDFPIYSDEQIELLVELLKSILSRYPNIGPIDIIGHSDIAIMRKSDPGPSFPWQQLYEQGIGAWPDDLLKETHRAQFSSLLPSATMIQKALLALGYQIEITGELDPQSIYALRAFQLHFRPSDYSGEVDVETVAILWALLEQYRPSGLADL